MRILIITHFFPPLNRMASSRPASWAAVAEQLGHEVTVITSKKYLRHGPLNLELPEIKGDVIEVDYPFRWIIDRSSSSMFSKVFYQLQKILWFAKVLAILVFRRGFNHDVAISTFSPLSTLFLGWSYAILRPKSIWVADYRDLWTDNPYKSQLPPIRWFCRAVQRLILRRSNLVVTISDALKDSLEPLAPGTPVMVVYNGYETQAEQDVAAESHLESKKTILYSGTIYNGKRSPEPLLAAVRNLFDRKQINPEQLRLQFLGDRVGELPLLLDKYQLNEITWRPGQLPRSDSLEAQRNASLLLMLGSNDPGILTGKIFEYLGAGNPILSLGDTPESAVGQMLTKTGSGIAVGTDVDKIETVLLRLVLGQSIPGFAPIKDQVKSFSRFAQGKRLFAEIERQYQSISTK